MNTSIREIGENIKDSQNFTGVVDYDVPLADRTTMRVGGSARVLIEPDDALSAAVALSACRGADVPVFVLGGGSNVVVPDEGVSGVVLSTARMAGIRLVPGKAGPCALQELPSVNEACPVQIVCGAGVRVDDLALWCARYGVTGLEPFAGLPGSVGGAAYMNARCYEKNFGDLVHSVAYIDLDAIPEQEAVSRFAMDSIVREYVKEGDEAGWGYKASPFQRRRAVITSVTLSGVCIDLYLAGGMTASPPVYDYIQQKNAYYIHDREQKGHFRAPSAGSVFKNNRDFGKPSGRIIDELGLKGVAIGGAQVAPWHGNFIINTGGATAADVRALVELIQQKVEAEAGFRLEPEIIFV